MRKRDWKEIARWAFVSGAFVFAVASTQTASSGSGRQTIRPFRAVTVDGCEYRLDMAADHTAGTVSGTLTVSNKTDRQAKIEVDIQSIDRTYTGRAMSRTIGPNDFKEQLVDKTTKSLTLRPAGSTTSRFTLKRTRTVAGEKVAFGTRVPSPMVAVTVGGKRVLMQSARTPVVASNSR